MIEIQEIERIVTELNQEIFETAYENKIEFDDFGFVGFSLVADGNTMAVEFLGLSLWDTEEDERSYRHDIGDDELEPLDNFLRRRAHQLFHGLSKIQLWKEN